jgi:predicted negative regulator of RcsB-dependent stress response
MATPSSRIASTEPRSFEETTDSLSLWFRDHSRAIAIGAIVVAAAGAGAFFWRTSAASKASRAEQAFFQAQAPVAQNDLPAAEKELARVAQQYDGTPGGAQAQMLLAQVYYEQGKYQQGIDALKNADDAPEALRSSVKVLTAGGYEGLNKPLEAARLYEEAAQAAVAGQRDELRASAARAYQAAGNSEAARKVWDELVKNEASPLADEARVRLGEVAAKPAS